MEVPTSTEAFKPDARAGGDPGRARPIASLTESGIWGRPRGLWRARHPDPPRRHPRRGRADRRRIGLPVALTLMSRDIRRKWDVGGVALSLESTEVVQVAARGMIERAGRAEPPVSVSGFTVQRR